MNKNLRRIEKPKSKIEELFNLHLQAMKIEGFVREYKFHPERKWKFDFAHPELKIAFECEGGIHCGGRHVRGDGYEKDCEKYNEAVLLGWRLFRVTSSMVRSGKAIDYCIQAIKDYLGMR